MAMIGLGVGLDYALFIVTRYRQGLAEGREPREAAAVSLATSGRSVMFAGTTVVLSLLGLFILQLSFLRGEAIGVIAAVLLVMLAAVTVLPAMLGFSGRASTGCTSLASSTARPHPRLGAFGTAGAGRSSAARLSPAGWH
jgi:RND superfamily putative drug exporter